MHPFVIKCYIYPPNLTQALPLTLALIALIAGVVRYPHGATNPTCNRTAVFPQLGGVAANVPK